jgi:hypothetical protein
MTRGIGQKGFAAALSDIDLVFNEGYFGISLPADQRKTARYLNAILNSSIVVYFLFLTSAVWGVERNEVRPEDVKRIPIPSPRRVGEGIVTTLLNIEKRLRVANSDEKDDLERELDAAVFRLYGFSESEEVLVRDLVEVTLNVRNRRTRPATIARPSIGEMEGYAFQITRVLQALLNTLGERVVRATVFSMPSSALQIAQFRLANRDADDTRDNSLGVPVDRSQVPAEADALLNEIETELHAQITEDAFARRTLRIYRGDEFFVAKLAQRRYWTKSAALYDADAIIAEDLRIIS